MLLVTKSAMALHIFLQLAYRIFGAWELHFALGCFLLRLCLQILQVFGVLVKLLLHLYKLFAIWKVIEPLLKAIQHMLQAKLILFFGCIFAILFIRKRLSVMKAVCILD